MQNTRNTPSESSSAQSEPESSTHFGYKTVREAAKAGTVAQVFHSVADRYDVMNDLMSVGLHRVWKAFTIGRANVRPGMKVLDIAGGTGDLARAFAKKAGASGEVRSEEHTSELQSLMRISYAVFCLKKKTDIRHTLTIPND